MTQDGIPERMRAVRFDRYGGREVLDVRDVPVEHPGAGEVLVRVLAAGINPGEAIIRSGALDARLPAVFPSGQGTDLAGVVAAVGAGAEAFTIGDEVLGYSWRRSSQAEYVVVPEDQLLPKPEGLPWVVAGALDVAGTTAWAVVRAVRPEPGDVVAVSAATGGVGALVVQLLVRRGATVLGIASAGGAAWLEAHGATAVPYGEGLVDRLRAAAPDGVGAFIDLYGPEYLRLAVALGVPRDRIATVVRSSEAAELGVQVAGAAALSDDEPVPVLRELARLLADGDLELPIAATHRLEDVSAAFAQLESGHARGKIVLLPASSPDRRRPSTGPR